jgi:5-methylcytosine-specific restriction endonuclease McrA
MTMNPKQRQNRRKRLIERDGSKCAICGKEFSEEDLTIDHIVEKGKGGKDSFENLQLACYYCNPKKSNKKPKIR